MMHGRLAVLATLFGVVLAVPLVAQTPNVDSSRATSAPVESGSAESGQAESTLTQRQTQLGERFERFETLLLRLADVEAAENPERAALLRRASRQARDAFILEKIKEATKAIDQGRYAQALKDQKVTQDSLSTLLQLLQSEDRQERIRQEKERIRQLINDLKRLERAQKSARGQTESGNDGEQAKAQQKDVEQRAKELAERLEAEQKADATPGANASENQDSQKPSKSDSGKPSEGDKPGEEQPKPDTPKEPTPAEDDPPSNDKPKKDDPNKDPAEGSEKDPAKDSKGDPSNPKSESPSKPSSDASENPQQSPPAESAPQTPQQQAAEQLQQAQEQMQKAMKALEESRQQDAIEPQREAEEKLREAAEKLERILKQLREEEIERQLTRLESRLKEISARQIEVLEKTKNLAATPIEQRDRQTDVQSSNLAFDEKKIAADTDRALLLLAEDGSGRAFPEVLGEVRDDMLRVSSRLSQTQLDLVTIGLQEDIVAALDEMIKSLQQEKRKREEEKKDPNSPMQGQQGQGQQEDPLVDQIAELKLIKTQEQRIKNSTERYSEIAQQSRPDADLLQLLDELSERQVRLYRVVRDIISEQKR